MTWEAAISYCEGLDLSVHSDWRLPNRNELQSLADYTKYSSATTFPDMRSSEYWSSTTIASYSCYAWYVSFDIGKVGDYYKSKLYYVRAVRGSPQTTATIMHVPTDHSTIQAAIDAANSGDTIRVTGGIYYENILMKDGIRLEGGWDSSFSVRDPSAYPTIIDGGSSGSVLSLTNIYNAIIDGFTITHGYASEGGGMYCRLSSPSIINCTISNNIATERGGGIYSYYFIPTIFNSLLVNNMAGGQPNAICINWYGFSLSSDTEVLQYGEGVEMLLRSFNPSRGQWESCYRFFGKPCGKNLSPRDSEVMRRILFISYIL